VSEWKWIGIATLLAIHDEQLAEHGGASGLRDKGLLESALARPINRAAYGEGDAFDMAAAYAFGIVRNHPFVDGNKRTGYVAAELFLMKNGCLLAASDQAAVLTALHLAEGTMTEEAFAAWLRENSVPYEDVE
jgi:death-on-curing protein